MQSSFLLLRLISLRKKETTTLVLLTTTLLFCSFHGALGGWVSGPTRPSHRRHQQLLLLGNTMKSSSTSTAAAERGVGAEPNLPLPPPICSDAPGTWAYDTMSRRVDEEILERTVQDCRQDLEKPEFDAIRRNIEALRNELRHAATTKLTRIDKPPPSAEDVGSSTNASENRMKEYEEWYTILQPFIANNDTWLTAPWMVTEFYVYRRLMQAIGYWDRSSVGHAYDPFLKQKQAGLYSSVGSAEAALAKIPYAPPDVEGLILASSLALWGNKMVCQLSTLHTGQCRFNLVLFTQVFLFSMLSLYLPRTYLSGQPMSTPPIRMCLVKF
jgi:Damage-control phosphatase ARMT1-like domain